MAFDISAEAYRAWRATRGIRLHEGLTLAQDPARGFFAATVSEISAGALLLDIPLSACLDLSPQRSEVAIFAGAPPLCRSALLLLREQARLGEHQQLLRALPPVQNVATWSAAGKSAQLLSHTSLATAEAAMPLRRRFQECVQPVLASQTAELRASFGDPSEETFLWACTLVMSRCFHAPTNENAAGGAGGPSSFASTFSSSSSSSAVGAGAGAASSAGAAPAAVARVSEGPYLIPVADLFNYHPVMAATQMCFAVDSAAEAAPAAGAAAGVAGEVASSGSSASSSSSSSVVGRAGPSFRYYALRDLGPGEEVFVSYGKLSDAQLLHTYGFVVEAPAPGSVHVRAAFQPLDFEAAGTGAGDGGGAVAALLRPLSFARHNPYDTAQLPFADVRAAVVKVLGSLGAGGPKQTKLLLRATQLLRGGHVIPEGGFTLQLQDPSLEGVRALEGLWGCEHPGQLLSRLLPPELLTALQVLLMPAEALAQYAAVTQEVAPSPLHLPLEPPSALIAKLAALKAPAGVGASGAAGSAAAAPGSSRAGAGASGAGGKRGRPTDGGAARGSASASASKRPRVEPQSGSDDDTGERDSSADDSDGSGGSDDDDEEESAAEVQDALTESVGVWTALLHAVTAALAKYPSTLKEDRAWYERLHPAGASAAPFSSSAAAAAESVPAGGASASAGAGAASSPASGEAATAGGEAAQADVERGRSDYLYRCSRLLCMREKEVLELVRGALLSELSTVARHEAAGSGDEASDDGSDDDASDEEAD